MTAVANGDVSTRYTYDGFGRVNQQSTIRDECTVMVKTIFYRETADHRYTTGQVSTLSYGINDNIITYTYTYDANGNIISITEDNSNTLVRDEVVSTTTGYTYDSMNQLIRENNEAAGKTWAWTYDAAGNILSRSEYGYTTNSLEGVTPADTVAYTYGDSNWGDLLTAYDGAAITHDAIGNPLNDGTWTYTWENGRQLASMSDGDTTWTYKYNADGLRTKRTNGSTTYEYTYSGDQLVQLVVNYATESETASRAVLHFTSDTVTYNGTTYYYVTNLQGDVIAILNGDGNPVVTYSYNAWGSLISTSGTMADTLGALNPLRYRGYVYDSESGLYYLQSRYYNPEMGRFLNADSYASTGQGVLGNNMFAYCLNNPVNMLDSDGKDAVWIQEGDSANGFGHAGLLVEYKEKWYYFYWGPVNENAPIDELIFGTDSRCVLVYLEDVSTEDLQSVDGVCSAVSSSADEFTAKRANLITHAVYISGDFSPTYQYIDELSKQSQSGLQYKLGLNNCVQQTCLALIASNPSYSVLMDVIPDVAFARLLGAAALGTKMSDCGWNSLYDEALYILR